MEGEAGPSEIEGRERFHVLVSGVKFRITFDGSKTVQDLISQLRLFVEDDITLGPAVAARIARLEVDGAAIPLRQALRDAISPGETLYAILAPSATDTAAAAPPAPSADPALSEEAPPPAYSTSGAPSAPPDRMSSSAPTADYGSTASTSDPPKAPRSAAPAAGQHVAIAFGKTTLASPLVRKVSVKSAAREDGQPPLRRPEPERPPSSLETLVDLASGVSYLVLVIICLDWATDSGEFFPSGDELEALRNGEEFNLRLWYRNPPLRDLFIAFPLIQFTLYAFFSGVAISKPTPTWVMTVPVVNALASAIVLYFSWVPMVGFIGGGAYVAVNGVFSLTKRVFFRVVGTLLFLAPGMALGAAFGSVAYAVFLAHGSLVTVGIFCRVYEFPMLEWLWEMLLSPYMRLMGSKMTDEDDEPLLTFAAGKEMFQRRLRLITALTPFTFVFPFLLPVFVIQFERLHEYEELTGASASLKARQAQTAFFVWLGTWVGSLVLKPTLLRRVNKFCC